MSADPRRMRRGRRGRRRASASPRREQPWRPLGRRCRSHGAGGVRPPARAHAATGTSPSRWRASASSSLSPSGSRIWTAARPACSASSWRDCCIRGRTRWASAQPTPRSSPSAVKTSTARRATRSLSTTLSRPHDSDPCSRTSRPRSSSEISSRSPSRSASRYQWVLSAPRLRADVRRAAAHARSNAARTTSGRRSPSSSR